MGNQFKGTLDGNGRTISNLNTNTTEGTDFAVGGVVGLLAANVSNCTNEADIKGNGADVAGIVGNAQPKPLSGWRPCRTPSR
ncbi:MAG: hypothetical protein IJC16_05785 [Rikenellaceae bacterium]|nr:hypothetical protein [Rikenellaceae bacterium]